MENYILATGNLRNKFKIFRKEFPNNKYILKYMFESGNYILTTENLRNKFNIFKKEFPK